MIALFLLQAVFILETTTQTTSWGDLNMGTPILGFAEFFAERITPPPVDHKILCQPGFIFDTSGDECVAEIKESQEVAEYHLQLLLHNQNVSQLESTSKCMIFQPFLKKLAAAVNTSHISYSFGVFEEIPKWWQRWNLSSVPFYISVRMQVDANDSNSVGKSVLNALSDTIPINLKDELINMKFILFNGSFASQEDMYCDEECRSLIPEEDVVITSKKQVFYEMFCPYLELTEGENYELVADGIRLVFEGLLKKSKTVEEPFSFHGDRIITICSDIYNKYYNETWGVVWTLKNTMSQARWTVTVVCINLSLLGLLLTFLTYIMFPELRTFPVKNNMALIFSLFVAQMIYVNGYLKTGDKLLCEILGISLHYFWLASVLWMNVCCYHVFKGFVLSRTIESGPARFRATLCRYFLYANGVPAIIVSTVITTNQILSEGQETGYGGTFCFLSTVLLNGLTVVLPLSFVLLSNFVFFTATICTINKTKQIRRHTGGERQNVWIYIKLSSITGLFWVLDIAGAALEMEALNYISTVLNSSQGVFLFVSYCCNKRIMNLWRDKLISQNEDQSGTPSNARKTLSSKQSNKTETTHVDGPLEESASSRNAQNISSS